MAGGAAHAGVRAVLPGAAGAGADGELLGFQRVRAAARVHVQELRIHLRRVRQPGAAMRHAGHLPLHAQVQPAGVGHHAGAGVRGGVFPGVPRAVGGAADAAVRVVHHPVLDVERDPHDLLGAAARAQWPGEPDADADAPDRFAHRVAAVLGFLGGARVRAPLHHVHDRAHLQQHDAHRPQPDRGRGRRGRERLADAVERGRAAVAHRHRHRIDLRHHHRHGRLRYHRRDGRAADRLGGQDHPGADLVPAVPARGRQRGDPAGDRADDHLGPHPPRGPAQGAVMARPREPRPASFWPLACVFALFVLFMYGPMLVIFILSFQGPEGGLTFPLRGLSLHWFRQLAEGLGVVDIGAALRRSLALGLAVMACTVAFSVLAGLAFRKRLAGGNLLFFMVVASLIMPSIIVSLGIGLEFRLIDTGAKAVLERLGWQEALEGYGTSLGLFTSALGAHLTWTLPFGLLIMFAVFNRFNPAYEEAARDLGATPWQGFRHVVLPLIAPSVVGIGMFGFTLSWDEIARTSQAIGDVNTLPLELQGLTTTVTTPAIYALGTVTTVVSFAVMGAALALAWMLRRRGGRAR